MTTDDERTSLLRQITTIPAIEAQQSEYPLHWYQSWPTEALRQLLATLR